MGTKRSIAIGTRFGECVYLGDVPNDTRRHSLFKCHCGKKFISKTTSIITGISIGCGCSKGKNLIEYASTHQHPRLTHGYANKGKRPEYNIWNAMRQRCNNPKNKSYIHYGGRGIKVCEKWEKFDSFIADMGDRPSSDHTVERINNDGNYEPSNCKWATRAEQQRNTRRSHFVTIDGVTKPVCDWEKIYNLKARMFYKRKARGWDDVRAIVTPPLR